MTPPTTRLDEAAEKIRIQGGVMAAKYCEDPMSDKALDYGNGFVDGADYAITLGLEEGRREAEELVTALESHLCHYTGECDYDDTGCCEIHGHFNNDWKCEIGRQRDLLTRLKGRA